MKSYDKLIQNLEEENAQLLLRIDNRYKETVILRDIIKKINKQTIDELNQRVDDAENTDNYESKFALENFLEWYKETFIY